MGEQYDVHMRGPITTVSATFVTGASLFVDLIEP